MIEQRPIFLDDKKCDLPMKNGDWLQFATLNHQIVYQMVIFIIQWFSGFWDGWTAFKAPYAPRMVDSFIFTILTYGRIIFIM